MRLQLAVGLMLLFPASSALPQISIQIGLPSVRIGINQPDFPQLVLVPGYPVYYDPGSSWNFFFYDGLYWVYAGDTWYASDWYNGPWMLVPPYDVPTFILRVPVSYYRSPPTYFRSWQRDAPPHWGEHWGNDWERKRTGWDRWNRNEAPPPAPLPVYQRQYSGTRYPDPQQQRALQSEHYRHEPRDTTVRQLVRVHAQAQPEPRKQAQPQREPERQAQPQQEPKRQAQPQREPERQPQPQQPQRQRAEPAAPAPHAQPQREPERQAQPQQPQRQRAEPAAPAPQAQPARAPENRGRQGGAGAPAKQKKAEDQGQGPGRDR
ncbi:MAG: hypothetical protein WCC48_19520 [Anaeromyxobacteraceae bacterium]